MRATSILTALLAATPALAVPNVMTDISPVHGLVSEVMGDLGAPKLLLPAEADTHHYALRPSDAQGLADADVIIWVGEGLTPWLADGLAALAPDATTLALLDTSGWEKRELHHADEGGGHGHDHGEVDPHAWLSPDVAAAWLGAIAQTLSNADPENAAIYARNAQAAAGDFTDLNQEIATILTPTSDMGLIWPHDAYGYFTDAFGLSSLATIAESDATDAGPAHIAQLRDMVLDGTVGCVLIDPEISQRWAQVLVDGTDVSTAAIDPIGAGIPPGRGFYRSLMLQLSYAVASCAAP